MVKASSCGTISSGVKLCRVVFFSYTPGCNAGSNGSVQNGQSYTLCPDNHCGIGCRRYVGVCNRFLVFDVIQAFIADGGRWEQHYLTTKEWFDKWGFWAIFIAGFSPIPYKVFTITAGIMGMLFLPFVIASAIGRGSRFFLVAGLMKWGGKEMEQKLKHYIDFLGWFVVFVGVIAYIIYKI